eukprot:73327_1
MIFFRTFRCKVPSKSAHYRQFYRKFVQDGSPKREWRYPTPPSLPLWAVGCSVVFGIIGTSLLGSAKDADQYRIVTETLDDFQTRPVGERIAILLKAFDLALIAPYLVHNKWLDSLMPVLRDTEMDSSLRVKFLQILTYFSQFDDLRNNLFRQRTEDLQYIIFEADKILKETDLLTLLSPSSETATSSARKVTTFEEEVVFASGQLIRELLKDEESRELLEDLGLRDSVLSSILDLVPDKGKRFTRFLKPDSFVSLQSVDLLEVFRERVSQSLLLGFSWAQVRFCWLNRHILRAGYSLSNVLVRSLGFGAAGALAGVTLYFGNALLDELIFERVLRVIAQKSPSNKDDSVLMVRVEMLNFLKLGVLTFAMTRVVPYSVMPFAITFYSMVSIRSRLEEK